MKTHFLTLEQAQKIRSYYKDKVIGYPIDKLEHPHWLISDVELVTVDGKGWNVVVWSKGEQSEGVEDDWFGLRKYQIMKYLIVYLRESRELSDAERKMWWNEQGE